MLKKEGGEGDEEKEQNRGRRAEEDFMHMHEQEREKKNIRESWKRKKRRAEKSNRGGERERSCATPLASLHDRVFSTTRERYAEERKERRALLLPLTCAWEEERPRASPYSHSSP